MDENITNSLSTSIWNSIENQFNFYRSKITQLDRFRNLSQLKIQLNGSPESGLQTQDILFVKSMSEGDGSDIERLWIWMTWISIDFESIEKFVIEIQSRSMLDPPLSDTDQK